MCKIKIRYKSETIIGEIIIIFCTIFYTCGQNVNLLGMSNVKNPDQAKVAAILIKDELKMDRIAVSEKKRYYFLLQHDDKKLCVLVSSNSTNIKWVLYFRNRKESGPVDVDTPGQNVLFNSTKHKRLGYSSDNSHLGLYTVEINSTDDALISVFHTAKQDYEATTNLMDIVDNVKKPRQIRLKFDFRTNSCTIEWPLIQEKSGDSRLDLFIVVSSEKYYKFLPGLDDAFSRNSRDAKKLIFYKNVTSEKSTIIYGLAPEEIYFVTLLAANKAKFSVIYGRTNFKFQKQKPLGLRDGKLVRRSLKKNGGSLSYKYKVNHHLLSNFSGPLIWYVSRCSGKIWVKIMLKKKLIEERLVSKLEFFIIRNLQPGNRYVMKITDASRDKTVDFDDVEVIASMRPHLLPNLHLPRSLEASFTSNRNTSTINWRPIHSHEPIQYCIYTKKINFTELTESSFESTKLANQCDFYESKASYNCQYCNILHKSTNRHLRSRVQNSNQDLAVQITAEQLKNKITVIYDLFVIPTRNVN